MHELSIAISIIELAEEEAKKANATSISKIEVEIGEMAGVEKEALEFCWDSAIEGTMAAKAELIIHYVPGEAHCLECGNDFPIGHFFAECPLCKSFRYEVTKGKELRVSSLMVD
jgi:hydrogenase nickel incorporation protein HypA/HybF